MGCQCMKNPGESDIYYLNRRGNLMKESENGTKLKMGQGKTSSGITLRGRAKNSLGDLSSYKNEILNEINRHRREHGVSDVKMNSKIGNIAQKYADQMAFIEELDFSGNAFNGEALGEMVFQAKKKLQPSSLVDEWYNEIEDHDFRSDDPEPNNFAQMVWKSTQEVGVGVSKSDRGKMYYVVNYYPPGNVSGYYLTNVFPKSKNSGTYYPNPNTKVTTQEWNDGNRHGKTTITTYGFSSMDNDFNERVKKMQEEFENFGKKGFDGFGNNDWSNMGGGGGRKNINKWGDDYGNDDNNNRGGGGRNSNDNNYQIPESKNKPQNYDEFCQEALEAHNKYRKIHHAPPLTLNKDLCAIAQNYAEKLAATNSFSHSGGNYKGQDMGENLYMCGGQIATGEKMTKTWYDEVKKYYYGNDSQSGTGHFTQIVWKDTKEVGFGVATSRDGSYYCVGNYYPAGNWGGEYKKNVLRP